MREQHSQPLKEGEIERADRERASESGRRVRREVERRQRKEKEREGGKKRRREGAGLESGRRLLLRPDVKLSRQFEHSSTVFLLDFNLLSSKSALDI